jgi:hypothetical protein
MRMSRVVLIGGLAAACGAGAALAAHPVADPATVPTGFLAAHTTVNNLPVSDISRALKRRKGDLFLEHVRLTPGQATPFHTHPGPAFIAVAAGSFTEEHSTRGRCLRKTFVKGTGFADPGRVHRLVAGPEGADYYATYLLPRRTGPHFRAASTPPGC